jgi:hypothetical protein
MFLARLKWINYLLTGLILHTFILLLCVWLAIPFSFKSLVISISCLLVWFIISAFLFNVNSSTNFLWSPFAIFTKRKFIYHNKLGYFLIFVSSKEIDIMEVKWFSIKEMISIKNTGNLKDMVKEMKEKLDEAYKTHLIHLKHIEVAKENIKVIKDWDGLLIDTDERRDNKIDKILKK